MREEDMSNISDGLADTEDKHNLKCPMCGTEGWVIEYPDDNGSGWFCNNKDCSFSCNPEDLPKMVAVMDLAKACVAADAAMRTDDDDDKMTEIYERFSNAERRVLEVFK